MLLAFDYGAVYRINASQRIGKDSNSSLTQSSANSVSVAPRLDEKKIQGGKLAAGQLWYFIPIVEDGTSPGYWTIHSLVSKSNKCLTRQKDGNLVFRPYDDKKKVPEEQRWFISNATQSDNTWNIRDQDAPDIRPLSDNGKDIVLDLRIGTNQPWAGTRGTLEYIGKAERTRWQIEYVGPILWSPTGPEEQYDDPSYAYGPLAKL
jgi:hypothetical protein